MVDCQAGAQAGQHPDTPVSQASQALGGGGG